MTDISSPPVVDLGDAALQAMEAEGRRRVRGRFAELFAAGRSAERPRYMSPGKIVGGGMQGNRVDQMRGPCPVCGGADQHRDGCELASTEYRFQEPIEVTPELKAAVEKWTHATPLPLNYSQALARCAELESTLAELEKVCDEFEKENSDLRATVDAQAARIIKLEAVNEVNVNRLNRLQDRIARAAAALDGTAS